MSENRKFVEMPLWKFIGLCGSVFEQCENGLDPTDRNYIIRVSADQVEIGYPADKFHMHS